MTPLVHLELIDIHNAELRRTGSVHDVARLARRVGARSLGVVLSGRGARGLAHLGVLDELVGAGARIDRVGGTSMGARSSPACSPPGRARPT